MKSSHIKCLNALCHRPSRHTVPVPGTCTCTKISKYPNIRSANLLICCKIAKYANIRSANPLICCKIAKNPISESIIFLSECCRKSAKYPKISSRISAGGLYTAVCTCSFSEAVRKRRLTSTTAFAAMMAAPYLYQVREYQVYQQFSYSKYSERSGSLATAKRSKVPAT